MSKYFKDKYKFKIRINSPSENEGRDLFSLHFLIAFTLKTCTIIESTFSLRCIQVFLKTK